MSKGNGGSLSVVNDTGEELVVTITRGGATPTVYTTAALSVAHEMPLTITATTAFWLEEAGSYTVSTTAGGEEIANGNGGTVTVSLSGGQGHVFTPSAEQFTAGAVPVTRIPLFDDASGAARIDALGGSGGPTFAGSSDFVDLANWDPEDVGLTSGAATWGSFDIEDESFRFNFTDPGLYWIQAKVDWSGSGTNMERMARLRLGSATYSPVSFNDYNGTRIAVVAPFAHGFVSLEFASTDTTDQAVGFFLKIQRLFGATTALS